MAQGPLNYEIPNEMRDFAEKSVEQAKKAFDGFLGAATKAVTAAETQASTVQVTGKDFATKAMGYAEQNVGAAFDLAQKLVRSKDVKEVMEHQAEFVKAQIAALQTQMQELGASVQSTVQKAATEAQANMQKATSDAQATVQKAAETFKRQ
ncbi:hypothetical protein GCM10007036_08550 [Alsobacter metallidurans]|uniref:Phasin domain-containing protein n=1 Tax=Alsobacter metallidurans TaxID=340221 RepID=A0A917I4Y5_9HYPH|nr:phasin [Alsobacter metallidurans]GGH11470.1 hypothetical protein GCM10007036_08550 [Alsobacter metallidurans]